MFQYWNVEKCSLQREEMYISLFIANRLILKSKNTVVDKKASKVF